MDVSSIVRHVYVIANYIHSLRREIRCSLFIPLYCFLIWKLCEYFLPTYARVIRSVIKHDYNKSINMSKIQRSTNLNNVCQCRSDNNAEHTCIQNDMCAIQASMSRTARTRRLFHWNSSRATLNKANAT